MIKETVLGTVLFGLLTTIISANERFHLVNQTDGAHDTYLEVKRFEDSAYIYTYSAGRWEATRESTSKKPSGSLSATQPLLITTQPLPPLKGQSWDILPPNIELYPQKGWWERRFDGVSSSLTSVCNKLKSVICCGNETSYGRN